MAVGRASAPYPFLITRTRLDSLLVTRGLFESRTQAAASILAGHVLIGPGRQRATKAGQQVPEDLQIEIVEKQPFVSRGGTKLANALDALSIDPEDRLCLDVGASTGGFTDCLLQRGAKSVIALDVAYGELNWGIRNDERVHVIERANARELRSDDLPYRPEFIVIDVSFISLTKILPAVIGCAASGYESLAMVKPQFEIGKDRVPKGGVVRDVADRRSAVLSVAGCIRGLGGEIFGFAPSGLPGPAGNQETFIWFGHADHTPLNDLEAELDKVDV